MTTETSNRKIIVNKVTGDGGGGGGGEEVKEEEEEEEEVPHGLCFFPNTLRNEKINKSTSELPE